MKNLGQMKLRKLAHILRIVIQVFFWVCVVASAVSFGAILVISLISDSSFVGWGQFNFSIDSIIYYKINSEITSDVSAKPILLSILVLAGILLGGVSIMLKQLSGLLKTVEEECPFTDGNVKRIKMIGLILVIGSVVYKVAAGIVAMQIINTYNLSNFSVNFGIDGFMLLSGFMMLILAGIFQYGNFLQQEYDSTL